METLKFKTTIKCSGCVAAVTPVLDKTVGKDNWKVDTEIPEKILSINSPQEVSEADLIKAIASAGYKAERIN